MATVASVLDKAIPWKMHCRCQSLSVLIDVSTAICEQMEATPGTLDSDAKGMVLSAEPAICWMFPNQMKSNVSLIVLFTLLLLTFSAGSFATDISEYPAVGQRFLDAFAKAKVGQELSTLSLPKGWADEALIQRVGGQTGIWDVWGEEGATVFRIFPYFQDIKVRGPIVNCCIVVKIEGPSVTEKQIKEAMEGHQSDKPLKIVEYSITFPNGDSIYISNKGQKIRARQIFR